MREWAIQNAEQWVRDYRIDGLRLDATHAIFDESEPHVMAELAERVRAARPGALVISEMEVGDRAADRASGATTRSGPTSFHHALHVLLTGERDGYYAPYGKVADLARAYEADAGRAARGLRAEPRPGRQPRVRRPAAAPSVRRLAAACLLFAPQAPLLFMGEEYGERAPFQFFTDHDDPEIARGDARGPAQGVRAASPRFAGEDVPDPQARETFERSKLDPTRGDDELRAFYARAARACAARSRATVETDVDEERRVLRVRRGERRARRRLRADDRRSPLDGVTSR